MIISHRNSDQENGSGTTPVVSVSALLNVPEDSSQDAIYSSLRRERDSALRELETTLWDLQRTRLEVLRNDEAHLSELAKQKAEIAKVRERAKKAEDQLSKAGKVAERLEKAKEGRRRAHVELGELRNRLALQLAAGAQQNDGVERSEQKAASFEGQLETARAEMVNQRRRMTSLSEERDVYGDALTDAREQLETMNQWAHTTINELDVRAQLLEAEVAKYRGQRGVLYRVVSRYRWETGGKSAIAAIEASSRESLEIAPPASP